MPIIYDLDSISRVLARGIYAPDTLQSLLDAIMCLLSLSMSTPDVDLFPADVPA